jgi:hypothetical protein
MRLKGRYSMMSSRMLIIFETIRKMRTTMFGDPYIRNAQVKTSMREVHQIIIHVRVCIKGT